MTSPMNIRIKAFGIAREIINNSKVELTLEGVETTGQLKQYLISAYPAFAELLTFSLAVKDEYQEDDFLLTDNDEVIIIPPVSGG